MGDWIVKPHPDSSGADLFKLSIAATPDESMLFSWKDDRSGYDEETMTYEVHRTENPYTLKIQPLRESHRSYSIQFVVVSENRAVGTLIVYHNFNSADGIERISEYLYERAGAPVQDAFDKHYTMGSSWLVTPHTDSTGADLYGLNFNAYAPKCAILSWKADRSGTNEVPADFYVHRTANPYTLEIIPATGDPRSYSLQFIVTGSESALCTLVVYNAPGSSLIDRISEYILKRK